MIKIVYSESSSDYESSSNKDNDEVNNIDSSLPKSIIFTENLLMRVPI